MTRDTTQPRRPSTTAPAVADARLIATGERIFKGEEGAGICWTCHARDAKGTPAAPDLTDQQWLNSDGSLQSIEQTIRSGVTKPKKHPAPMPPFQSILNDDQIRAVATYVFSLSHPQAR